MPARRARLPERAAVARRQARRRARRGRGEDDVARDGRAARRAATPSRRDQQLPPGPSPTARRSRRRPVAQVGRVAQGRRALSRMQRSTTGTKRRPAAYAIGVSTPPQRPGQTSAGCAAAGRGRAGACRPPASSSRAPVDPVPGDDASGLAGAEDDSGRRRSARPRSRSRARRASSPGRTRGASRWPRSARRSASV